jgi:CrcB protein
VIDVRIIAVVGLGAALGGILRYLLTQFVVARAGAGLAFTSTLLINVSGSFLIGAVLQIAQSRADLSPLWRYFLATGILGGYTTFSTFSFEALSLASSGLWLTAAGYVAGSVVLGIGAAFAGMVSMRALEP